MENLNKEQLEAVTHKDGPLLIVAGAGTGKTTVLINRLLYLITEKKVDPDKILLTTFTEKGAGELVKRADVALPLGYVDLWINTFHSFCERILREHALDIGIDSGFKLVNQTDQWILIKKNLDKFNLDYYRPLGNPNKFIHELIKHFSRLKDEDISPKEYLEYAKNLKNNTDEVDVDEVSRIIELANAYHIYNQLLLDNGYLDFGDLIVYTLQLFKTRKNILEQYRSKFEYIMVDEFQDTNWAQYELIKMLAAPKNNLIVVGDDDQAIYRFRGASMSNIMQFKDDYKNADEIVLINNYRSGQNILDHAYTFIQKNNPNRLEEKLKINKQLKSHSKEKGEVDYIFYNTVESETANIAKKILTSKKQNKYDWKDFVVLVRANDTADRFVKEFSRQNIPNVFVSLKGLYYKPIILDMIAYLRLLDNYHESSALFRVLDMDIFNVRQLDIVNMNKLARYKSWSLFETLLKNNLVKDLNENSRKGIEKLLKLLRDHTILVKTTKTSNVFVKFIYDSGVLSGLDRDKDREIFSYLNQFYIKIKKLEENNPDMKLKEFIETIDMELNAGETGGLRLEYDDSDVVKVMTVHAAKGLEFKEVFLVDLVDKKFPTINRSEKIKIPDAIIREKLPEGNEVHTEEERRLFYVAMTRAKESLHLSGARDNGGMREKKISKFIEEAGIEVFDKLDTKLEDKNELERDLDDLQVGKKEKDVDVQIPVQFSFSQLAAYDNCPLQYKFNFVLKIPVPTKNQFLFGRIMHDCLYKFLLPLMDGQNNMQANLLNSKKNKQLPSKKDLLDILKTTWKEDGWESKNDREEYRVKAKKILEDFYTNLKEMDMPDILFLEKKFSFKIKGELLKGAIDRVDRLSDGTLEVIDYKTGNPKEKLTYKEKRQLILYKLVLEELLGQEVSMLSFYYLEDGSKIGFKPAEKDIEKLKQEIVDIIASIKELKFEAKPNMFCKDCDFRGICEFRK